MDELAKKLFPNGVEIKGFNHEGWTNTQQAIARGDTILFQPTVVANPLTCRADILTKSKEGDGWDLNEVKMATSVKPDYLYDVGFQRICFEKAGIKINRTKLVHINKDYVRHGDIEIGKLFVSEDITDQVEKKLPEVQEGIEHALKVMEIKERLDLRLIEQCNNPKNCDYLECYCKELPALYPLVDKLSAKSLLILLNREIVKPENIKADVLESVGYKPQEPFTEINASAIKAETPIPPFDGTWPYQQIPFQYSLTIKDSPTAPVRHAEFLMRNFKNPVPELLSQLEKDIGKEGSVIVWYAPFETARNREMAEMVPDYADLLQSVNERMFDLMVIFKFKNQMYIKSEFKELASLKIVLPVLCPELSYEALAIREGGEASASWPVLTSSETPEWEKSEIEKNMLAYCQRDTDAMVAIMDRVLRDINPS